jgi:hypothetical protein
MISEGTPWRSVLPLAPDSAGDHDANQASSRLLPDASSRLMTQLVSQATKQQWSKAMAESLISRIEVAGAGTDADGSGTIDIFATENADGSTTFHVKMGDDWNMAYNLDLNGLFLDYAAGGSTKLTVDGQKSINLNGATDADGNKIYWDIAVSSGSNAGADGGTTVMEFFVTVANLTFAEIDGDLIGLRATSTGFDGSGSLKLVGVIDIPEPPRGFDGFYGLSQGFWSNGNGLQDWDIAKTTSFEALFGVNRTWDNVAPVNNGTPQLADLTLLEAITMNAGSPENQLANQAVAAYLNSIDEHLNYRYTPQQVIDMVRLAYNNDVESSSTDDGAMTSLASNLEYWNAHAGENDEGHLYAQSVNQLIAVA